MAGESSYAEYLPAPALAAFAWSVWIQQVGDRPLAQRHEPHGGAEVRCVLGEAPRLLGPLTASTYQEIPAGGTVVGVRLRPGVLGGLVGLPAEELLDQDVAGTDVWRDLARVEDLLGEAATPRAALDGLQSFVAHRTGEPDPLVDEAVRHLMPSRGSGPAGLPTLLSISERQLRRRCRAAVGVGPKELHRILRLQGFVARVRASIDRPGVPDVALARWAVEAGYHDQAHLSRECRRLLGVTPGEYLAQSRDTCSCGHDHAASYVPMLGQQPIRTPRVPPHSVRAAAQRADQDGRFLQERRPVLCYVKDCGRAIALLMLAERLNHRIYNVSGGRLVRYDEVVAAINAAVPGAAITLPQGRNPTGPRTTTSTSHGCGRTPDSSRSTTSSAPCRTTPAGYANTIAKARPADRRRSGARRRSAGGVTSRLGTEEQNMTRVVLQAVVSVDGYIAYPDDTVGPLFDWYGNGDTELSAWASGWTFRVSRASADHVQPFWDAITVTVIGRHLFDTTNGWDGKPAAGDELVVVTHRPLPDEWLVDHPDAPFHTADSVEAGIALAKELADDGLVCVTAGNLGGQAFSAGLVDEVAMDVVPVVLGDGVRFFGSHTGTVLLDDPDQVVQGDRVLHLHYTVKR